MTDQRKLGIGTLRDLFLGAFARLNKHKYISIAVVLLALILTDIPGIPEWIGYIKHEGATLKAYVEVLFEMIVSLVSILVFIIIFGLSTTKASEMVGRPKRFIIVLLIAGTVASICGSEASVFFNGGGHFWQGDSRSLANLFDTWIRHLIGGALFGWLYFLYRQRSEDAMQFASVLTRRSILLRQIAQSRLVATRAKIDPELVTRVLKKVQDRHPHEPEQALQLLNQMISHLRLAMNRLRELSPSIGTELALCNSYSALQQAHRGALIGLHAELDAQTHGIPLFLIFRQLLDQVLQTDANVIELRITTDLQHMKICANLASTTLSGSKQAALRLALDEFNLHHAIELQHSVVAGSNLYTVLIKHR